MVWFCHVDLKKLILKITWWAARKDYSKRAFYPSVSHLLGRDILLPRPSSSFALLCNGKNAAYYGHEKQRRVCGAPIHPALFEECMPTSKQWTASPSKCLDLESSVKQRSQGLGEKWWTPEISSEVQGHRWAQVDVSAIPGADLVLQRPCRPAAECWSHALQQPE